MNRPDSIVSVVILTWNRRDDLAETLEELSHDAYANLEIIVVDNASSDGTAEMLRNRFPLVKLIQEETNRGIAGYNTGFKSAAGDYIVALDSDSYPQRDAISKSVELFRQRDDVGIIAFDVHTPTESSLASKNPPASIEKITGYHGAGVAFRRDVFDKAGYWYEPFFLYFNEMDHALRAVNAGFKIVRRPDIRAFHKSSAVSRPSANGPYYYVRNALWLVWRNYPLLPMLLTTLKIIYLAVAESVYQGTWIYLKAVIDGFRRGGKVFDERNPLASGTFNGVRIPINLAFSRWG